MKMKRILGTLALPFLGLLLTTLLVPVKSVQAASPGPRAYRLYCASDDFYRHFCPVDAYAGVDLIRQRSQAACIYGRTWGLTNGAIWVDRGCRADFGVGAGRYYSDDGYRSGRTVYCASDDFGMRGCRVNTFGGVSLVRQRSEAPCILGRTWGYDDRGIWVDRGCRADFALGGNYRYERPY